MSVVKDPQVANSPIANSSTSGQAVTLPAAAAGPPLVPSSLLLFSNDASMFPTFNDGYYAIIQNTGTVNLEVMFNTSGAGIVIYPSATFECALSEGTNVWLVNVSTTTAAAAKAVVFA